MMLTHSLSHSAFYGASLEGERGVVGQRIAVRLKVEEGDAE